MSVTILILDMIPIVAVSFRLSGLSPLASSSTAESYNDLYQVRITLSSIRQTFLACISSWLTNLMDKAIAALHSSHPFVA